MLVQSGGTAADVKDTDGKVLTVIVNAATAVLQVVTEYDIVAVPPAAPDTFPLASTLAIDVLLLLQTPPLTPSLSIVDDPVQTPVAPVIVPADAAAETVTTDVALSVQKPVVTV